MAHKGKNHCALMKIYAMQSLHRICTRNGWLGLRNLSIKYFGQTLLGLLLKREIIYECRGRGSTVGEKEDLKRLDGALCRRRASQRHGLGVHPLHFGLLELNA